MAAEHLITSTIEGRTGALTVGLYRKESSADHGDGLPGSPSLPVELDLVDFSRIKGGEVKRQLGGGALGALWEATFLDPAGHLVSLFGAAYVEEDYYVRVTGPDGHGGTFYWWGSPMPVELEEEQAPDVYAGGEVLVRFRDGIGRLQGAVNAYTSTVLASQLLYPLRDAAGLPVTARLPVWPEVGVGTGQAPDYDVNELSLFTQPFTTYSAGGGLSENTAEDALAALAKLQTLSIFQATDVDGAFYALPRALVGTEIDDATTLAAGGDTHPVTVAARSVTVDGEWGGEPGGGVPRKGRYRLTPSAVRVTASADVNLVRDDRFEAQGGGAFPYWSTVSGASAVGPNGGLELEAGDVEEQALGRFAATAGLRFYLWTLRPYLGLGSEFTPLGDVRLILDGDDGTTYYGPDWATSAQDFALTWAEDDLGDVEMEHEGVTAADLPVSGALRLQLRGDTSGADDAEFLRVRVAPVQDDGEGGWAAVRAFEAAPVADYVAPATGDERTIPLPSATLTDGTPVLAWESLTAGATYDTLRDAAAAERLAQTAKAGGEALTALVTTIPGLVGPQFRVTLQGAAPFDGSPLVAVVTGYEIDLRYGLTRAALCEATTEGLT